MIPLQEPGSSPKPIQTTKGGPDELAFDLKAHSPTRNGVIGIGRFQKLGKSASKCIAESQTLCKKFFIFGQRECHGNPRLHSSEQSAPTLIAKNGRGALQ